MGRLVFRLFLFGLAAGLPLLFVVLPISTFLVLSFFHMENNQVVYEFGISNYLNFFRNWTYFGTFLGTLWLCAQVMTICIALGYPIAWFVWRRTGTLRYFLL